MTEPGKCEKCEFWDTDDGGGTCHGFGIGRRGGFAMCTVGQAYADLKAKRNDGRRDMLIAAALGGLTSVPETVEHFDSKEQLADACVSTADAVLEAADK